MAELPPGLDGGCGGNRLSEPTGGQPADAEPNSPDPHHENHPNEHGPGQKQVVVVDQEASAPDAADQAIGHGGQAETGQERADRVGPQRVEQLAAYEVTETGGHAARRTRHSPGHDVEAARRQPQLTMRAHAGLARLQPGRDGEHGREAGGDPQQRQADPQPEPSRRPRRKRGALPGRLRRTNHSELVRHGKSKLRLVEAKSLSVSPNREAEASSSRLTICPGWGSGDCLFGATGQRFRPAGGLQHGRFDA